MTTVEFNTLRWPFSPGSRVVAPPYHRSDGASRPRLAIISTYDGLCGIASYTRSLEKHLNDVFTITVFDLDQYLLRSTHRRARRFADRHIREICRQIRGFDAVNLQLEHGTLGQSRRDIYRRFCWIVKAAPRISVTFHTIFLTEKFDYLTYLKEISRMNLARAIALRSRYRRAQLLSAGIAKRLRRAQRSKPVTVIVHTRRDHAHMKYVYGLRNVYDHPLSFLDKSDVDQVRKAASRKKFPILDQISSEDKLIGLFGFFGYYKGFETAVRALHHLPENYHLIIFGSVHPNEIKMRQYIDPVLSSLFEAGYIDASFAERIWRNPGSGSPAVSIAVDGTARDLLVDHPKDLSARIHFLGARPDGDFLEGMAICDVVVFPYVEVGQSSSGPISQALELGCRVIASRTHTFLQLSRYHERMIEFFDIGNHLELATRIVARPEFDPRRRPLTFDTMSNRAIYLAANTSRDGLDGPPASRQPGDADRAGARQQWDPNARYGNTIADPPSEKRD